MLEVDFSFGMYEARSDVGEGTFSNTELSEWVHIEAIFSRVQRDLNPRPAAPQAVILSMLNYEPIIPKE